MLPTTRTEAHKRWTNTDEIFAHLFFFISLCLCFQRKNCENKINIKTKSVISSPPQIMSHSTVVMIKVIDSDKILCVRARASAWQILRIKKMVLQIGICCVRTNNNDENWITWYTREALQNFITRKKPKNKNTHSLVLVIIINIFHPTFCVLECAECYDENFWIINEIIMAKSYTNLWSCVVHLWNGELKTHSHCKK